VEELEELGDEAIISQQTAAHAPQPRANFMAEARSVVIADQPEHRDTEPRGLVARPAPPKSSAEQTLVIRDRRALDDLRSALGKRKPPQATGRRALYFWGALGLAAFLLGGLVAFLATDSGSDAAATDGVGRAVRGEAPRVVPASGLPPRATSDAARPERPGSSPKAAPRAVRVDELPVLRQ